MKKMTVTELNAITDYVVENVLEIKREAAKKARTNITEGELNDLLARAKELADRKEAAKKALEAAQEELNEFSRGLFEKNYEGRYVHVDTYYTATVEIREYNDDSLFNGTKLEPWSLQKDVQRKLVLKNLASEVDVEAFVKELVNAY